MCMCMYVFHVDACICVSVFHVCVHGSMCVCMVPCVCAWFHVCVHVCFVLSAFSYVVLLYWRFDWVLKIPASTWLLFRYLCLLDWSKVKERGSGGGGEGGGEEKQGNSNTFWTDPSPRGRRNRGIVTLSELTHPPVTEGQCPWTALTAASLSGNSYTSAATGPPTRWEKMGHTSWIFHGNFQGNRSASAVAAASNPPQSLMPIFKCTCAHTHTHMHTQTCSHMLTGSSLV